MNDTLSFSFYLIQNLFHHLVCHRVGKNHRRLKRLGLFKVHQCIRHDNNNVIRLNPAGCRAVQTDFARTALAFNDVSFKTFTVIIVGNGFFMFIIPYT